MNTLGATLLTISGDSTNTFLKARQIYTANTYYVITLQGSYGSDNGMIGLSTVVKDNDGYEGPYYEINKYFSTIGPIPATLTSQSITVTVTPRTSQKTTDLYPQEEAALTIQITDYPQQIYEGPLLFEIFLTNTDYKFVAQKYSDFNT